MTTRSRGAHAEQLVSSYLAKKGYTVMARNYTKPYGELDVVAQYGNIIAFVEVKMRVHEDADAASSVTAQKQRRIIMTAQEFMHTRNINIDNTEIRFDVAVVHGTNAAITYIEHAFDLEGNEWE